MPSLASQSLILEMLSGRYHLQWEFCGHAQSEPAFELRRKLFYDWLQSPVLNQVSKKSSTQTLWNSLVTEKSSD